MGYKYDKIPARRTKKWKDKPTSNIFNMMGKEKYL